MLVNKEIIYTKMDFISRFVDYIDQNNLGNKKYALWELTLLRLEISIMIEEIYRETGIKPPSDEEIIEKVKEIFE